MRHNLFKLNVIFFANLLLHIVAKAYEWQTVVWVTKPLIIPILLVYFYKHGGLSNVFNRRIFAGLILSWIGDILLMIQSDTELFFILGLASFLCAHILYINAFLIDYRGHSIFRPWPRQMIFLVLGLVCALIFWVLLPYLNELKIPVGVYAITISLMTALALGRFHLVPPSSYMSIVVGAIAFLISDTLLALNKFTDWNIAYADTMVMLFYGLAQIRIMSGAVYRSGIRAED